MPTSAGLVLATSCGAVADSSASPLLAPFSVLLLAGDRGASGGVVGVVQLWGGLGSRVRISLLNLNVIFACSNINYLNITNIPFNFHGDGEENNFLFCIIKRVFSVIKYRLQFGGGLVPL